MMVTWWPSPWVLTTWGSDLWRTQKEEEGCSLNLGSLLGEEAGPCWEEETGGQAGGQEATL